MGRGLTRHQGTRIPVQKIIVRSALLFSVLAVMVAFIIIITANTANKLMSTKSITNISIPSNILPPYLPTSFTSFDNQTNLSAWFFKVSQPKSTIILVHDTGSNRLQFDVETVDMIEDFMSKGYNVFLFDQRNSGESSGNTSAYGYMEWRDVIGAIDHVRKISVTQDVILYGVGTGCSSSMLAIHYLPTPTDDLSLYPEKIRDLEFDRTYIAGLILDSPAKYSDDYLRPIVEQEFRFGFLTKYFVPYAIRISSGESENVNLASQLSRLSMPVCILYGEKDTFIGKEVIDQMVAERERLHPNTTIKQSFEGAGYIESYETNSALYLEVINNYLGTFFS